MLFQFLTTLKQFISQIDVSARDMHVCKIHRVLSDVHLQSSSFKAEIQYLFHPLFWLNFNTSLNLVLQVCLNFPVPLLCGTLVMLSQIVKYLPDVADNFRFPNEEEIKDEPTMPDIVSNLKKFEDDDDDEKVFDVKTEEVYTTKYPCNSYHVGFCISSCVRI